MAALVGKWEKPSVECSVDDWVDSKDGRSADYSAYRKVVKMDERKVVGWAESTAAIRAEN